MNHLLRWFTAVFLAIYVPLEIWSSPRLWDLFFIVDVIGMTMLGVGLVRYQRQPQSACILAAGFGWTGANFWRSMAERGRVASSTGDDATLIFTVGGVLVALALTGAVLAIATTTNRPNAE